MQAHGQSANPMYLSDFKSLNLKSNELKSRTQFERPHVSKNWMVLNFMKLPTVHYSSMKF